MLKKFFSILGVDTGEEEPVKPKIPLEILNASYQGLCRLAEQIDDHAQKAPYSFVTQRLKSIAAEKRSIAGQLKEAILKLNDRPEEPKFEIGEGRNHWERIANDIEDQRTLDNQFLEYAVLLGEEAPEISGLLEKVVSQQAHHRDSLLDLIARADPQANLT